MQHWNPIGRALILGLAAGGIVLLVVAGCQHAPVAAPPPAPAKLSFNEDIEPILAGNCYGCHGPDPGSRKAGLRLDRADFPFLAHEKFGAAIIRFQPDKSPLVKRVESKDEKEMMPPAEEHKTLKPDEIARLRRWIAEGAQYQEHWSFIAPTAKTPPQVPAALAGSVRNPIDQFIIARLSKEHLGPSPEADRRSQIRRVTLDLTGLPPTPAEADAFVADSAG